MIASLWRPFGGVAIEQVQQAGVRTERITAGAEPEVILLYLHGGGYVSCSPMSHRPITVTLTRLLNARTYVPDYRLAPEHAFPAAIDDAFNTYQASLRESSLPIILAGDSAGGGLAIATVLRARDAGLPLPKALLTFSPWVDLTSGRETALRAREHLCDMFYAESIECYARAYLGPADSKYALGSPLYADLAGLPPLLLEVSDTELLYSEAAQLAERSRAAGNVAELNVSRALPHGWQMLTPFLPEARESLVRAAAFARCQLPRTH